MMLMSARRVLIAGVMLFSFVHHGLVAGDDAEDLLAKLQKKYESIRDASLTFTQHAVFGVTKAEQTFDGRLLMKKGKKYRIEMEQQTIVTDGISVWTYSVPNKQVRIDKFRDDPKAFLPDRVMVNIPENYAASLLDPETVQHRELAVLKLVPRVPKTNIRWMKLWVDEEEMLMRKVQVMDRSENLMTYTLNDIKVNTNLSDSQFQFTPPPNTEVIDLR